ncbi:hypothetical protein HM1_3116 [Heliomicrobium modesticaldum Ice1]|uniref:Uncharacterized protein n=1 Tax=Heliobacterium modesticaldum (strain ATCC 51547 / Ice1) TaxID=498761 RepID=B0TED6_HELMI|nr:hypothetical protein HM1_3116 [Heliomicrobium modesticaldum Ice1]
MMHLSVECEEASIAWGGPCHAYHRLRHAPTITTAASQ